MGKAGRCARKMWEPPGKARNWWIWHIVALFGSLVVLVVPLLIYHFNESPKEYEWARVVAASVSAAVAFGVGLSAVVQYRENSRATRVARSMEFWRRSNENYFGEQYKKWVDLWEEHKDNPEEWLKEKAYEGSKETLAIENVLDFFDEACLALMMGACDDESLYVYLGPLMRKQVKMLKPFIETWRKHQGREEKWSCLTTKVEEWEAQAVQEK